MARFRLKGKHYINIPGNQWEQEETNQATGKKARKRYTVPMYLDPDDPSDHNYPGEIIIATEFDRHFPKDIVFIGPPTPDMEPLDETAEALFDKYRPMWEGQHPIESLPGTFGEALVEKFQKQIDKIQAAAPNVSLSEIAELKKSNEELREQVNRLLEMATRNEQVGPEVSSLTGGSSGVARRV